MSGSEPERIGDDLVDDPGATPRICLTCIGDRPLRTRLTKQARPLTCTYCGKTRRGVALATLAAEADGPLRAFCVQGATVRRFSVHTDDSFWDQQGEDLVDLLQYETEIGVQAASDLADLLERNDPAWPPDGEEKFFDRGQRYHRTPAAVLAGGRYSEVWDDFATRIKHGRRFFDAGAVERLGEILGRRGSHKAKALPALEIGPGTPHAAIFRARVATSEQQAHDILAAPAAEIGPPPVDKATVGRMNPAGISVFYGALGANTAIAEVRPNVGGLVAVAEFAPTRALRVLDLTQIGNEFTGSIFAGDYADRVSRRQFLRGFHALVARPVRPGEEPIAYVPTQAVAEYVVNVLGFDGLLFASVQVGALGESDLWEEDVGLVYAPDVGGARELGDHNVVLLGAASRVQQEVPTDGVDSTQRDAPGLRYVDRTAVLRRVTGIAFTHDEVYVPGFEAPGTPDF